MDFLEETFDRLGLMTGDLAPMKRFAVGAALGGAVAYGLKPSIAYDEEKGEWRPFGFKSSSAPAKPGDVDPTLMPAWLITVLPGVVFSVLI